MIYSTEVKAMCPVHQGARHGAAPIEMSLISSNGDVTGIDTIQTIDRNGNSRYYDLQGREIDGRSAKGLVIKNGKKVIIK